jgi:hypothetical protein
MRRFVCVLVALGAAAAVGVLRAEEPGVPGGPPAGDPGVAMVASSGGADSTPDRGMEIVLPAMVLAPGPEHGQTRHLSDLSVGNFFTEGWNQEWEKWRHYTPDMALLRVTTNFLERELRADYAHTDVANSATTDSSDFANMLMAYALNRRLMLEVIGNYQWNDLKTGDTVSGASAAFLVRLQLVENATQSYSFQSRVSAPNKGIGQTQTPLTFGLAGWQDVHAWIPALGRFGLYFSFQYEDLLGPHKAGATQNDVTYDVSIAETWTTPSTPVFGNLTTFLEAFGQTFLDGTNSGKTNVTLTPGVRFWFIPENSFTFGVDLPVSHAPAVHSVVRATYILNF